MVQKYSIENTTIDHKGKPVNAKIVSVTSFFNTPIDEFFKQELLKANTLEIVKPLAKITFLKNDFSSKLWQQGFEYELEIKPFGLVNIWGTHYIKVISIDHGQKEIITKERNNICKVWDHTLTFTKIIETETGYTDKVILYAGAWTNLLSRFLVFSYKARHKNWNTLLKKTMLTN